MVSTWTGCTERYRARHHPSAMLFSSQSFILIFLPLSLWLWFGLAQRPTARLVSLAGCSFLFYAWWDARFLPLLLVAITANWAFGRWISQSSRKRTLLTLGITTNLLLLGFFKYANFFAGIAMPLAGREHAPWDIVLPLAISFFTFQHIAYLVDASRGNAPRYSWLQFASYVAFFPHLIAGPIVRHHELIGQLSAPSLRRDITEFAGRGLLLFAIGLFKKVALADELADLSDPVFASAMAGEIPSAPAAWTAAIAYSLQLYYDFSGYTDMAIGLAALFGLSLPINFDAPYRTTSVREFWRRWHMTLSRFLRDYLYIPLGGSRGSFAATCLVTLITMLLCGLWHGAGWTFVAWGGLHGLALCVNQAWSRQTWRLPVALAWPLTMIFVICGWVLFRAETFTAASNVLQGMWLGGTAAIDVLDGFPLVVAAGVLAVLGPTGKVWAEQRARPSRPLAVIIGIMMMLIILRVGEGRSLDFIYFQF